MGFIWGRHLPRGTPEYIQVRGASEILSAVARKRAKRSSGYYLQSAPGARPRLFTRILFCAPPPPPPQSPACMRQTRRRRRECVSDMTESKQRTHESPPQARHAPGRGRPLEAGLSDRTLDPPQASRAPGNGVSGVRGAMTREGKVGALHTTPPAPAPALLLRY